MYVYFKYLSVYFVAASSVGLVRDEQGDEREGMWVTREERLGDEGLEVALETTPPRVQECPV